MKNIILLGLVALVILSVILIAFRFASDGISTDDPANVAAPTGTLGPAAQATPSGAGEAPERNVQAGERIAESPEPATSARQAGETGITGRVIGPRGRPVAAARVTFLTGSRGTWP